MTRGRARCFRIIDFERTSQCLIQTEGARRISGRSEGKRQNQAAAKTCERKGTYALSRHRWSVRLCSVGGWSSSCAVRLGLGGVFVWGCQRTQILLVRDAVIVPLGPLLYCCWYVLLVCGSRAERIFIYAPKAFWWEGDAQTQILSHSLQAQMSGAAAGDDEGRRGIK